MELPVRVALRHVAVELVEAARELLRALAGRPQQREGEVRREHRDDVLAGVEPREVHGEERRAAHAGTSSRRARLRPRLRSCSRGVPNCPLRTAMRRRKRCAGCSAVNAMPPKTCSAPCATSCVARPAYAFAIDAVCSAAGLALVERRGRVEDARPRALHLDVHVREQVPDRLEAADRLAELAALRRICAREVEHGGRCADRLRRGEHTGDGRERRHGRRGDRLRLRRVEGSGAPAAGSGRASPPARSRRRRCPA